MNIYSYFPKGAHRDIFNAADPEKSLVVSGVHNVTAKTYFVADLFKNKKYKNVFWVLPEDNDIYEVRKTLPFWTDDVSVPLDNLVNEERHDPRLTETVWGIHNHKNRYYLIGNKDLDVSIPTYQNLNEQGVVISKGEDIHIVDFFNQLIQLGYEPSSDVILGKGQYRRSGGVVNVFPPTFEQSVKIEVDYDKIAGIWIYDQETKQIEKELDKVDFLPIDIQGKGRLVDQMTEDDLLIVDDIDDASPELTKLMDDFKGQKLVFTSFPKSDEEFHHLRYLSVLKYYNIFDLLNDLRDKIQRDWTITLFTKRATEIRSIFREEKIQFADKPGEGVQVVVIDATDFENVPPSFQNPELKIQLLTDKEIFNLSRTSKKVKQDINLDFLTGLKVGDLVVHYDHGIGRFLGVVSRTIDEIHREYLEIAYAENDRLFVPIDQADKLSKYVGGEENEPNLSRLGAADWKQVSERVKKEAQKIAKELLKLYAKRSQVKRKSYAEGEKLQEKFDAAFPYEETPGQLKAIQDVMKDMESTKPMDRLVCGDVGFGKTEVAMRAAFKAAINGKQVAFIAPITILADQHYKSFVKRASGFDIKIEMLSRFRTPKEQREILERARKGDIDILIGTHRLLQPDVKFMNLGLVIIDEEQRFGVKQKEKFKEIRNQVDILTLTATPIPRTLNLGLNNLRDISTITTPPPGRLPIITEVRRYGDNLVKEVIQREVDRGGQVYFLHNRVQTIEGIADKLRKLLPNIRFIVAHGQLQPAELERRILKFKNGEIDVLISSTIVENGIDLPNANTLIVDNAENFGLSQLYQLRGRIGRGKTQAYAYFLYQSRQPRLDAKRRLRAIVEASELGSGFQVALRDLEIRGAGDILGVNQHGTIKVVGANHFLRMLNKAIAELREGRETEGDEDTKDVSIELPLEAYIPDRYIPDTKAKINVYQKLSAVESLELLEELREDIQTEYGPFKDPVTNLFKVLQIKILSKKAGLINVKALVMGNAGKQIVLQMGPTVRPPHIMNLLKYNPKWLISGDKLKIDMKELGFNWSQELQENIKHLIPKKADLDAPVTDAVKPVDNNEKKA